MKLKLKDFRYERIYALFYRLTRRLSNRQIMMLLAMIVGGLAVIAFNLPTDSGVRASFANWFALDGGFLPNGVMQRTADCGSPAVPKPTRIHAEKRSPKGSAPPAVGESIVLSESGVSGLARPARATFSMAAEKPPAIITEQ